jgi:outer membrane lipoprotein-sorting protein
MRYDEYLKGTPEKLVWGRDAKGKRLYPRTEKVASDSKSSSNLILTIDGRTFLIIQCWFNDALGNTTRLRFSDTRLNTGIPDHVFTFKPPEGVEVVNMTQ